MDVFANGRSRALLAAAAAAAAAALLWRVASEPVDFGYVRYLGIADEMARSGDWVVMRIVDALYLDKPPLFFWLMAPLIAVLGAAPAWVAHAPDLLALALALACIHRLGAAIYGEGTPALAGALVFATTWETFNQLTSKRLDPVFAALLTAALTAFYLGARLGDDGRPRQRLLVLAWLAVALASLTKGPLAIVLFLLVAGPWAAWTGRTRLLVSRGSLLGAALLVCVVAPWPALLIGRLGFDEALALLRRTDLGTRTGGLLLYARNLPVLQLPWTLFLPALAVWLWRLRPWKASDGVRFLVVWFLAIFAALHFSETKHQRYLMPATPALSLLLVGLWYAPGEGPARQLAGGPAWLKTLATAACLAAIAVIGAVAGAGLLAFDRVPLFGHPLAPERWIAGPAALATACGAVAALASLRRGGLAKQSPLPLALLLLGVLTCMSLVAAGDVRRQDTVPLARAELAPIGEGRPAALLGLTEEQRQLGRLLTRRALPLFSDAKAAAGWARQHAAAGAWIVTDPQGRRALAEESGLRVRVVADFELAQEPVEIVALAPAASDAATEEPR